MTSRPSFSPAKFLAENGALIALVVLFAVNVATRGASFLQVENLRNLVNQSAVEGVIAIGMTLVIVAGGIDLSVGSMLAMCGAGAILLLNKASRTGMGANEAILLAAIGSITIGALAGAFNGFVVAYGRVAAFVVTLGGLAAYRSLALVLGDGGEIRSNVPALQDFGFGGVAIPFVKSAVGGPVLFYWNSVLFIVIAVIFSLILDRTVLGRYVRATGANTKAAIYSGISVQRVQFTVFMLLGGLVGVAALMEGARMNSVGTGSVGLYYELDAIAAVVIGGTSLRGGTGKVWGSVIGIILLTLISNMITAYHIDTNWQGLVRGAVILVAVLIQRGTRDSE